jgi:predicted nucleotidyltransferase component of viral defense system
MKQLYLDTARLLVQVAPYIFTDRLFALKGGTAINLFVRDLPRLSVDLDLVFVDHAMPREQMLARIDESLRQAAGQLRARGFEIYIPTTRIAGETKLFVRRRPLELKIEPNFVIRGTVHPVRTASLSAKARETLLADVEIPVVSLEDMYGGKLVAAMDRQHPRDLFDVMQLYEHEGITPTIRRAFVVYLASHKRPIHEVLFPVMRDIAQDHERTFEGMTTEPVDLTKLVETRARLAADLHQDLDMNERKFLLSLVRNTPDWGLLDIEHLEQLPAIHWKLENLTRLAHSNPRKFAEQAQMLEGLLGLGAQ